MLKMFKKTLALAVALAVVLSAALPLTAASAPSSPAEKEQRRLEDEFRAIQKDAALTDKDKIGALRRAFMVDKALF
jgi:hypothetical protein